MSTESQIPPRSKSPGTAHLAVFAALGVALMVAVWIPTSDQVIRGWNDFVGLYAGARLIGTPDQFNLQRQHEEQWRTVGVAGPVFSFTRLPAFAVALRPLTRLPYQTAYFVWQALSMAALVGFMLLWPTSNRPLLVAICCWFFPLSASFANGQDLMFILLFLALGTRCADHWEFGAGIVLGFCALKPHLFVPLPLVLCASKRWRMLGGMALTGGFLLAISFLVAGENWIPGYLRLVTSPAIEIEGWEYLPNIYGIVRHLPHSWILEIILGVATVTVAIVIARRCDFRTALEVALVAGFLTGHHSHVSDLSLLLPAVLELASRQVPESRPALLQEPS